MMTTSDIIRTRRSTRKFKAGADVSAEQVNALLEAAMMAPSACNTRPWEFVVVKSREKLDEIVAVHPFAKMLATASLAIVVCALPEKQKGISLGFFPQDCAAASQNILLQATELGLGVCWCGVYPNEQMIEAMRNVLGVSSVPFNVIAIGAADEVPKQRGFFDEGRVTYI